MFDHAANRITHPNNEKPLQGVVFLCIKQFVNTNNISKICFMYIVSIKFTGAFPDGDKTVEISSPNGGGGDNFTIMINNFYQGKILFQKDGWRVAFQVPTDDYSAGDLQPLIDLVTGQTN